MMKAESRSVIGSWRAVAPYKSKSEDGGVGWGGVGWWVPKLPLALTLSLIPHKITYFLLCFFHSDHHQYDPSALVSILTV